MKIEFPYDATYNRIVNRWHLGRIVVGLSKALNYHLPRFTFRDHLRDCFGWLWLRPKRESTPSPFTQAMISLFADRVAPTDFLTPIFHSFLDSDEEVEIDIVRGEQP